MCRQEYIQIYIPLSVCPEVMVKVISYCSHGCSSTVLLYQVRRTFSWQKLTHAVTLRVRPSDVLFCSRLRYTSSTDCSRALSRSVATWGSSTPQTRVDLHWNAQLRLQACTARLADPGLMVPKARWNKIACNTPKMTDLALERSQFWYAIIKNGSLDVSRAYYCPSERLGHSGRVVAKQRWRRPILSQVQQLYALQMI